LEPFKNNVVCAGVYVREVDWDVPIESFRVFLWTNAAKAIWTCVERLKQDKIQVDESKLKQQLLVVESEFLGGTPEPEGLATLAEVTTAPLNECEDDDEEQRLIVQYQIGGHGGGSNHDKRAAVENLLGEFLEEADLGYCDGGDIGSGTMNVFCFVKPGQDVGKKIIELLRKNSLLDGSIIAEEIQGEEQVIWPPDFKGEFQLI
jgi:hypothetical protein